MADIKFQPASTRKAQNSGDTDFLNNLARLDNHFKEMQSKGYLPDAKLNS